MQQGLRQMLFWRQWKSLAFRRHICLLSTKMGPSRCLAMRRHMYLFKKSCPFRCLANRRRIYRLSIKVNAARRLVALIQI